VADTTGETTHGPGRSPTNLVDNGIEAVPLTEQTPRTSDLPLERDDPRVDAHRHSHARERVAEVAGLEQEASRPLVGIRALWCEPQRRPEPARGRDGLTPVKRELSRGEVCLCELGGQLEGPAGRRICALERGVARRLIEEAPGLGHGEPGEHACIVRGEQERLLVELHGRIQILRVGQVVLVPRAQHELEDRRLPPRERRSVGGRVEVERRRDRSRDGLGDGVDARWPDREVEPYSRSAPCIEPRDEDLALALPGAQAGDHQVTDIRVLRRLVHRQVDEGPRQDTKPRHAAEDLRDPIEERFSQVRRA
jgi:hypothetical protein